jgi:hypothetical protein
MNEEKLFFIRLYLKTNLILFTTLGCEIVLNKDNNDYVVMLLCWFYLINFINFFLLFISVGQLAFKLTSLD